MYRDAVTFQTLASTFASAMHLAFALVLWFRRDRGNIALPLSLLFLDTFVWTFAELAYALTGAAHWHFVDHVFSSLLPALTTHVIVAFVGKSRAMRTALQGIYALGVGVAALAATWLWWRLLLPYAIGCVVFCGVLLSQHWRQTEDGSERGRTGALLLAVAVGTLLSVTDLVPDGWHVPKVSTVGMLLTLSVIAVSVLRLQLLGRQVASRSRISERERLDKLVGLGRFSEQLAHDLRNPLAALKGAIQFLRVEREQGRSLDDQAHFLDLMLEQVERSSRVLDAYQRIAKVEPVLTTASLNDLVGAVLELQRFASTPDVQVRSELDRRLPKLELDAELVSTTLENLLRNAFEAMPAGGTITVTTLAAADADGTAGVALSIADQGEGMDVRVLERATDQFFTTKANGSGLGLSFADRVARAHGGRLELSSVVGRGTTVRIWMPLRAP